MLGLGFDYRAWLGDQVAVFRVQGSLKWGLPKIRCIYWGARVNKDLSILESIFGSFIFGKLPNSTRTLGKEAAQRSRNTLSRKCLVHACRSRLDQSWGCA